MPRSPSSLALAFLGASLFAGLTGCVPPKEDTAGPKSSKNAEGEEQVCHQEYPTGSHIGRTVCRSVERKERDRKDAVDLATTPRSNPTRTPVPEGGQ